MKNLQKGVSTPAIIGLIVLLVLVVWVVMGSSKQEMIPVVGAPSAEESINDATSEEVITDTTVIEETTTETTVDVTSETIVQ
jgi:hypothetical protein